MSVHLYSYLSYPACKLHLSCAVLYCHLWPVWLCHIFPHYLINDSFWKKLLNIKCVLIFSTTFVWNISHSKNNAARYHKCHRYSHKVCYSCQSLIKLEFSWQIFEMSSNIKFHENPSSVSRVVPGGRTDRHDKADDCFSQVCERA
jgi:hypothetical protein